MSEGGPSSPRGNLFGTKILTNLNLDYGQKQDTIVSCFWPSSKHNIVLSLVQKNIRGGPSGLLRTLFRFSRAPSGLRLCGKMLQNQFTVSMCLQPMGLALVHLILKALCAPLNPPLRFTLKNYVVFAPDYKLVTNTVVCFYLQGFTIILNMYTFVCRASNS